MKPSEVKVGEFYAGKSLVRRVLALFLDHTGTVSVLWQDKHGGGVCSMPTFTGRTKQKLDVAPFEWPEPPAAFQTAMFASRMTTLIYS